MQTNGKHTHSYIYKEKYKNNNTNKTKKIWEKASKTKKKITLQKEWRSVAFFSRYFFIIKKSLRIFFKIYKLLITGFIYVYFYYIFLFIYQKSFHFFFAQNSHLHTNTLTQKGCSVFFLYFFHTFLRCFC